jgi:glucose-1-phosphate thymidylyltransferase
VSTEVNGILLAGGAGSRLFPMTTAVSKHLLPIYDKPMIYYPLTTLMLAGVTKVWLVCDSSQRGLFERLLGDGKALGISIEYAIQETPRGIVDAFSCLPTLKQKGPVWLALGDNLFFGSGLGPSLAVNNSCLGASIFLKEVKNPQDFGVAQVENGKVVSLQEKPKQPKSPLCITGLYRFDETVWSRCKAVQASDRGELEITELLGKYLSDESLSHTVLGRGTYWLDTGTAISMAKASSFVESVQSNSGDIIGSPHEAAVRTGLITVSDFAKLVSRFPESTYGDSLRNLASVL